MKLNQLYEVKPVCVIASDNVQIDGDIVFYKDGFDEFVGGFTHAFSASNKNNILIKNTFIATVFPKKQPIKIKLLWIWHMMFLRKSHIYLTGAMK